MEESEVGMDLLCLKNEVPDHFVDHDIIDVKTNQIHVNTSKKYPPSLGLLLKLRRAARHACRTVKNNTCGKNNVLKDNSSFLWALWCLFVLPGTFDFSMWTPELLFSLSEELREKCKYLNGSLVTTLGRHALIPSSVEKGIIFDESFLKMVSQYHDKLERPESSFEDMEDSKASCALEKKFNLTALSVLPRDICPSCLCRKQAYCGDCFGIRMRNAESLLPRRVTLPFNVIVLIDWHESLHRCTGVHAAALCKEGTVSFKRWLKSDRPNNIEDPEQVVSSGWASVAKSFNSDHDFLLFPSNDSICVHDVEWNTVEAFEDEMASLNIADDTSFPNDQKLSFHNRIVVIESTWGGAKTMVSFLQRVRSILKLPPLRCVCLPDNISGMYWKLQHIGNAAVSTIEALYHAAIAAACPKSEAEKLLTLFFLQRYHLKNRIKSDGHSPRAIDVRGTWRKHNTNNSLKS